MAIEGSAYAKEPGQFCNTPGLFGLKAKPRRYAWRAPGLLAPGWSRYTKEADAGMWLKTN